MRTSYLVCYDISDEKRLRKVFQSDARVRRSPAVLGVRVPVNSDGPGAVPDGALGIIHHGEDQVLFVNLGPAEGRGDRVITALGKPYTAMDAPCIIV